MSRNVLQYDLLISCPGDITAEISVINKVVENFNSTFSDILGITLRTKHWSKNSYAQSGEKPQALLNKQFVEECDAAIAIFWTRFGSPTDEYGSGTEEEIEIMLNAGKQVFMYFSDKPISPSLHNQTQYSKVQAFRQKYKDRGVYFTYASDQEFERLFFAHLSQHFLSEKRVAEIKAQRKPTLCLKGINASLELTNSVIFQKFDLGLEQKINCNVEAIKQLFEEIINIPVCSTTDYFLSLNPVKLDQTRIDLINLMAKQLKIVLPETFFNLGNLSQPLILPPSLLGTPNFEGSKDEQRKYHLIQSLYFKIIELSNWLGVDEGFKNIMCIKLALANIGTMVDEDIDVTLTLPHHVFTPLDELPPLSEDAMHFLSDECDMQDLLGIPATAIYNSYSSALKDIPQVSHYQKQVTFFNDTDYTADYLEDLEDVFCYDIYKEGNNYIIKIKFDYLKHHTTVAFPAAILLKEKPNFIHYSITSKNSADIVEGDLAVD